MRERRSSRPQAGTKAAASVRLEGARKVLGAALLPLVLLPLAHFHYLVPDSAGHVAYVRSWLWDADVDFDNDYARFGMTAREGAILFGETTPRGKPGNPFGAGSAVLWLPGVLVARGVCALAAAVGAPVETDGFSTSTLFAAALGTWTWTLLGLWLVWRTFAAVAPERGWRRLALAGACLGTPLPFYVLQLPTYAHAPSAFAAALVLFLGVRWRADWTVRRAFLLGAAAGFAGLVRAQDLAFGILPPALALAARALDRRRAATLAAYLGGGLVAFAPQLWIWNTIYGTPWTVPQGDRFLQFSAAKLLFVLGHPRHGLAAWSPVVLPALAGWVLLVRDARTRGLGIAVTVVFAAEALLNALPADWWAGYGFGARRFVSCVPLFALGLWRLAAWGRTARAAIAATALAGLLQWLRVASGALSAEADPGWDGLWGTGFLRFLPEAGPALGRVLAAGWSELQLVQRPQAPRPELAVAPEPLLAALYAMWLAGVLAALVLAARRLRR